MIELLIVALAVFGYAMTSHHLGRFAITSPMAFTTVGLVVGAGGFGWFDLQLDGEVTTLLVEATLVLVLFTDAIRIDLAVLAKETQLPGRLLGIGFPLTIVFGIGAAALILPGLTLVEAALLATVLAPTDAALGQAVVTDERLPVLIRQTLNIESGLNDGIAVPVVAVLLAATAAEGAGTAGEWIDFALRQIGFGALAGIGVGVIGGRLLRRRDAEGSIDPIYRQLAAIALAVGAFSGAHLLGGNGFVAVFLAGLSFARVARDHSDRVQDFTEDEGELLTAITFVIFGAALVGPALDELTWSIALYVLASLTLVRMVPVLIALADSGTLIETRLFIGWFGPRGLASILFALLVVEEVDSPPAQTIFTVATWTILVSVFAHGITAAPWSARLGRRLAGQAASLPEMQPSTELPTRRRLRP